KRMRPHTLTVPKPLLPIAGKPIVQRLVEDLSGMTDEEIDEVAFIIADFGEEVKETLHEVAGNLGAKCSIYKQEKALGTAHAILCAKPSLKGNITIAFADTLFRANFNIDPSQDGIIWVQKVEEPSSYGVVKINDNNVITDFVEKPDEYVSNLAIIGIYYIQEGEVLRDELQYLIDNDIKDKGEYQLTNALENMKNKGYQLVPGEVNEWLDCGKKDMTVHTNQRILEHKKDQKLVADSVVQENAEIIQPSFVGDNVTIKNAVVGPHVSIGDNSTIEKSVISNTIIQTNAVVKHKVMSNSMIGNHTTIIGQEEDLSIGDYTEEK
ncbi:MAG: nucleotidyltransferase, partial [Bacteroidetes bacterium SW_11_45_7]